MCWLKFCFAARPAGLCGGRRAHHPLRESHFTKGKHETFSNKAIGIWRNVSKVHKSTQRPKATSRKDPLQSFCKLGLIYGSIRRPPPAPARFSRPADEAREVLFGLCSRHACRMAPCYLAGLRVDALQVAFAATFQANP